MKYILYILFVIQSKLKKLVMSEESSKAFFLKSHAFLDNKFPLLPQANNTLVEEIIWFEKTIDILMKRLLYCKSKILCFSNEFIQEIINTIKMYEKELLNTKLCSVSDQYNNDTQLAKKLNEEKCNKLFII